MRFQSLAVLLSALLVLSACAEQSGPTLAVPENPAKAAFLDKGYRQLTGAEIRELVSGNTVEGRYNFDTGTFVDFYAPDGRITSLLNLRNGEELYQGRWSIDGERLCFVFPENDSSAPLCIEQLEKDGHIVDFRTEGVTFGKYYYSETLSFTPGNVKNLPLE